MDYAKMTIEELAALVRKNLALRPSSDTASLNAACGRFKYRSAPNGTIVITDPEWTAKNIVSLTTQEYGKRNALKDFVPDLPGWPPTPILRNGKPAFTTVPKVWCHRLMAPALVLAWRIVFLENLQSKVATFDGLWVPRHQLFNPSRPLSVHSWGMAIDFAARTNGFGAKPQLDERVAQIFEFYGFAWGGRWRGPRGKNDFSLADGMHFEYCDPLEYARGPIQDGVLKKDRP